MHFISFATWPPTTVADKPPETRVVGVLGDDFCALALEDLAARRPVDEVPRVKVIRVRQTDDLAGLDVLLVGDGYDGAKWNTALNGLRTKPVLTVGAGRIFAQRHGQIGLYLTSGRLRFAINLKRVQESGLELSSRLLGLAEIVED